MGAARQYAVCMIVAVWPNPGPRHGQESLLYRVANRMRDTAIDAEILKNLAQGVRRLGEAQGLSQVALAAQAKMGRHAHENS